jgi:hypothetical protein
LGRAIERHPDSLDLLRFIVILLFLASPISSFSFGARGKRDVTEKSRSFFADGASNNDRCGSNILSEPKISLLESSPESCLYCRNHLACNAYLIDADGVRSSRVAAKGDTSPDLLQQFTGLLYA